jgi:hypothetical protein
MQAFIALAFLASSFLQPALKPVVIVAGQSNAVGSAPQLAARLPNMIVVNCALDGSPITRWQRGQDLYEKCLAKVQPYQQAGNRIAWIFWMQGERDSYDAAVAPHWRELFYQFAHDFRADLNMKGAPVVYAQLGPQPTDKPRPYWRSIQYQQSQARIGHPNLIMIRSYDISPYCPAIGPHWCDDGYGVIARRAIHAYRQAILSAPREQ